MVSAMQARGETILEKGLGFESRKRKLEYVPRLGSFDAAIFKQLMVVGYNKQGSLEATRKKKNFVVVFEESKALTTKPTKTSIVGTKLQGSHRKPKGEVAWMSAE